MVCFCGLQHALIYTFNSDVSISVFRVNPDVLAVVKSAVAVSAAPRRRPTLEMADKQKANRR